MFYCVTIIQVKRYSVWIFCVYVTTAVVSSKYVFAVYNYGTSVVSKTYVTSVLLVRISYLIGVSIVIVNVVTKALSVAASTL